jgi:predicted nuclease with TOPRIM domain
MKQRFYNQYADWYKKAKEKAEQELAQKVIEEMRKTALRQELVYSDLVTKLEEAYKENRRLGKELNKARQEIKTLKGRFTNHVVSVVRNAKYEMLVHALRQRPDRKNIANALK